MTYQAGLSGGAWLLSSFAGNNYPTITTLKNDLWAQAFEDSLLVPDNLLVAEAYADIVDDIAAKDLAGFSPTLTDVWGRLLSYQLLEGTDGGAGTTLSSVSTVSNFTSHNVPFPLITSLGVKTFEGECLPGPNATTYEFSPYEFGSWDSDVSAFTPTKYLGTSLSNGKVTTSYCINNYDNLGYVLGTSSSLFNEACLAVPSPVNSTSNIDEDISALLDVVHEVTTRDLYAVYPNPFYNYQSPTGVYNSADPVSAQTELDLVDGGEALQNNPIFPMLQPARGIDVLLVNDNSADTSNNFPNGSEILTTYVQTFNHNLTRMPYIPSVDTFISEGLNQRATFFGCNATDKITIVYLPNYNFTFQSNVPTAQLEYQPAETDEMVANGVAIASQNGTAGWGVCLGCAILSKTKAKLPSACGECFEKYCYYGTS